MLEKVEKVQEAFMEKAAETTCLTLIKCQVILNWRLCQRLNYEGVWPEAAQAQEAFDKKATSEQGKIVRNGQKAAGLFWL